MQFLILEYDYVTWKPRIINSMNYNSEQKYWDTNQVLPSPIYNVDNQVISSLSLKQTRHFLTLIGETRDPA